MGDRAFPQARTKPYRVTHWGRTMKGGRTAVRLVSLDGCWHFDRIEETFGLAWDSFFVPWAVHGPTMTSERSVRRALDSGSLYRQLGLDHFNERTRKLHDARQAGQITEAEYDRHRTLAFLRVGHIERRALAAARDYKGPVPADDAPRPESPAVVVEGQGQ